MICSAISANPLSKNVIYFSVIISYCHQIFQAREHKRINHTFFALITILDSASSVKTRTWRVAYENIVLAGRHHAGRSDLTHGTAMQLASAKILASYTWTCTVVFGLALCCTLVGNIQTLDPLGSQLAPTSNFLLRNIKKTQRKTHTNTQVRTLKKAISLSSNWVRSLPW